LRGNLAEHLKKDDERVERNEPKIFMSQSGLPDGLFSNQKSKFG
jgi:hypothetical protein